MKKTWLVVSTFIIYQSLIAQRTDGDAPTRYNGIGTFQQVSNEVTIVNAAILNSQGLKFSTNKPIDGSAFLNPDWQLGYVRIKSNAIIDSIPMKWNAVKQEIMILDGEKEYFINDHFTEFGYTETINGKQRQLVFKTGFPPIKKNTSKSVYQLLAGKNLQLLKFTIKELQENRAIDGQTYYRIADEITYYVYDDINETITVLRKGIEEMKADLPGISAQIDEYCKNNKQKCKTEEGLIELFSGIKLKIAAKPF